MDLINKWKPTGLLDDLNLESQEELSELLEDGIEWIQLDNVTPRVANLILPIIVRLYRDYEYDFIDLPYLTDLIESDIESIEDLHGGIDVEAEYALSITKRYFNEYNGGEK